MGEVLLPLVQIQHNVMVYVVKFLVWAILMASALCIGIPDRLAGAFTSPTPESWWLLQISVLVTFCIGILLPMPPKD